MSPMDDTNPNRGRPVLKRIDATLPLAEGFSSVSPASSLWVFCGAYEGTEKTAVDAAAAESGPGIYKVFPSGSWPGGYLRD